MARARRIAALAALFLCLLPAAVHAESQTLGIQIFERSGGSGKAVTGVKVDVLDMQGNLLGSAVTDSDNGVARITFELPDGADKVLVDTDAGKAQGRGAFSVLNVEHARREGMGVAMYTDTHSGSGADLVELAKGAIGRCDKVAYDRWSNELRQSLIDAEAALEQAQQNADDYARGNNLRVTDLAGATKDRDRAVKAQEKLDPALRNDAVLDSLDEYIRQLQAVGAAKRNLDARRQAQDAMPPFSADCKKDKFGYLPGDKTCPDGSGGMLAGAINDIFGSDLDPVCDSGPRRRDVDRPKKERDREHRED